MSVFCFDCGRELTSARSVRIGKGPVCEKKDCHRQIDLFTGKAEHEENASRERIPAEEK